ncbi:hypothetical protein ACFL1R_08875 [Candidatus Latescibacterota bacterium]
MSYSLQSKFTRRKLLAMPLALPFTGMIREGYAANRKRVAAIITEYRRNSHAEVLVGKMLEGYSYYGKNVTPRVEVVSMYTDRVPDNDMSRAKAAQYNVPIYPTVSDALTMGTGKLAVDGVVLVGEHGDYHWNLKEQHLYPRWWLYKQIMDVFRETGSVAPVFTDKHFSVDWDEAKWMYNQSHELNFPLMAGSSAPLVWRIPELELDLGTPLEKAVVTFHGGKESYGFHAMEVMQCMVERRKGGETGIAAVQCKEGAAVWKWTDANPWAEPLLNEAIARCPEAKKGSPRDNVSHPILFLLEYRDGLQAALYRLNGHLSSRAFAAKISGKNELVSTQFRKQLGRPYGHFSSFVHYIEELIITGKPSYPVERTLLTTGALAALMNSSYYNGRKLDEGRRIETPLLDITYRAQKESLFNRGALPVASEDFGIGP